MKLRLCLASFRRMAVVIASVGVMTAVFWMLNQPVNWLAKADTTAAPGDPLPNLTPLENTMFGQGVVTFGKDWDPLQGLGPDFTQVGCQHCHSTPVNGGPGGLNGQVTFFGKIDTAGKFDPLLNEGGLLLQPMSNHQFLANCRFIDHSDPAETLPVDATIRSTRQAPTLFGAGLIDNIPDSQILANAVQKCLGQTCVRGVANMVKDENRNSRVGHFGLKAQVADLLQFSGQAEQHELGVTNPINQSEDSCGGKPCPPGCDKGQHPLNDGGAQLMALYHLALYLAPVSPVGSNDNGAAQFHNVGCDLCHIAPGTAGSYTTAIDARVPRTFGDPSPIHSAALSRQPVNLYSDLLLHDLGGDDGDGIPMSLATGNQWRTAPLWGTNIKINNGIGLLHDGGAIDVRSAIAKHGGEATGIVNNFNTLAPQDQDDLIDFLNKL